MSRFRWWYRIDLGRAVFEEPDVCVRRSDIIYTQRPGLLSGEDRSAALVHSLPMR